MLIRSGSQLIIRRIPRCVDQHRSEDANVVAFVRLPYNRANMLPNDTIRSKATVLYDAGGWFVYLVLLGVPAIVGLVLDYFWNYLVLSLSLRAVHSWADSMRKHGFCFIVTPIGLVIDWVYYRLVWGGGLLGRDPFFAGLGTQVAAEIATILAPMVVLAIEYFVLVRFYLREESRNALIISGIMAFFTAPWLIVGYYVLRRYA